MEKITTKICSKCSTQRPVGLFTKHALFRDGLHNWCKPCVSEYDKQRYQSLKNNGGQEWANSRRAKCREYQDGLRIKVLRLLGSKCALCYDDHEKALTIDHIYGKKHYGHKSKSVDIIRRDILADPSAKQKYRILCIKCNWLRRYESDEEIIARYDTKKKR